MYTLAAIFLIVMLFMGIFLMRQADRHYKEYKECKKYYKEYTTKNAVRDRKTGRNLGRVVIIIGIAGSLFCIHEGNKEQQQKHEFNVFISKNYEKFDTLEEARSAFAIEQAKQAYKKYLKENSL